MDPSSGYVFSGLGGNTTYDIIVVATGQRTFDVGRITQSTGSLSPVLQPLSINAFDVGSITLAPPSRSTAGNPAPDVLAYIGQDGIISISETSVTNFLSGPVDVSSGGHQFTGLSALTSYRIFVVAQNSSGYSSQSIVQSTGGIAPSLNGLSITSVGGSSITLAQPTLATAGNPSPTVRAYVGLDGTISVSGATVSNYLQGPVDVSAGGTTFSGLNGATAYRIIVVAQNSQGSSVQQIAQTTSALAPVLNSLSYTAASTWINLAQPTFSTPGNPAPTVQAYIGLDGTISVSGNTVSNYFPGVIDVSLSGHTFTGLTQFATYTVIVVAENAGGYSVQQFTHMCQ